MLLYAAKLLTGTPAGGAYLLHTPESIPLTEAPHSSSGLQRRHILNAHIDPSICQQALLYEAEMAPVLT